MGRASSPNDVRTLVLVGRTGNGKSATGNSILGRKAFISRTRSSGVTHICELQRTIVKDGPVINVIDTPGLFDGTNSVGEEIVKSINMAKDGIHAILMVLSIKTRFSEEEQSTFLALQALFGKKIVDYMIVVFTGGDELEKNEETLDDYLGQECPQILKEILNLCGNRKILFDNKSKDKGKQLAQVQELLNLVNTVISNNGGRPFTNDLFKELKEKEKMMHDQQKLVGSIKGYSKADMQAMRMEMQQKHEEELKRVADMVESKLKEETTNMLRNMEERLDKLVAEQKYKRLKQKTNDEIERLKKELDELKNKTKPQEMTPVDDETCAIL